MNWNKALADIASCIALLAAMPYELGQLATLFPPQWKPWLAGVGAAAAIFLRLYNARHPQPPTNENLPPNR